MSFVEIPRSNGYSSHLYQNNTAGAAGTNDNYGRPNLSQSSAGPVKTLEDSALGIGQIFSTGIGSFLPQQIAPRIFQVLAGSGRALGGLVTAATSGYRIWRTYQDERAAGSDTFPNTRKEVVVSASSIGTGLAVGSLAGFATAGLAALGAPALIVGGAAAAGIFGVGYAVHKSREVVGDWYDGWTGGF